MKRILNKFSVKVFMIIGALMLTAFALLLVINAISINSIVRDGV